MKFLIKKWVAILSFFCAFFWCGDLYSQNINVSGGLTANDMATILLGTNVTISNAQFTGGANSSGAFTQGVSGFPIADGVLLTTGTLNNAVGPNNATDITGNNGQPGDSDLDALIPGFQTYDATVLEFDITSNCTELSLEYIFASEEYLEYGCSSFNDVFGFFISGPGYSTLTNIALVPGTTTPVSIDNVIDNPPNCVSNPAFYVDNPPGTNGIQYDGRTVLLTAQAVIQPCQTYHIKIAIADAGDSILDSGIFLKGGGVNCTNSNLDVTSVITNVLCNQLGSIDLTVNSGTGPFVYQWVGPNGFTATTEDVSGLLPGEYTVEIIGSDCLSTGQFVYTILDESDQEPPVITCPSDVSVSADLNSCSASNVSLGNATPTDNWSVG
ncbi:MAG: SprB repeat-containing protein, partial [Crocinitomicaceae bacterium]|nr:SprB repeat-containing protein [Crocinitomicaceae bacterium]